MNDSRGTAREHYRTFQEVAISSAALVYFVGFVYLYYYYANFGVSLFAIQVAPQHTLVFAYSVLTHNMLVTVGFVTSMLLVTAVYGTSVDWLTAQPEVIKSDDLAPFRTVLVRESLRRLVPLFGAILILVMFPLSFGWAHAVAREDGALLYQAAHEGSRMHVQVIEARTGMLYGTPGFDAIIKAVNDAGREGRAIPVGESGDRLFILVGVLPHGNDDPRQRLPGDSVYAIEKSDIAVKEVSVL